MINANFFSSELLNPGEYDLFPPVSDDIGEGLDQMDDLRDQAIEFEEEGEEFDPEAQNYFMRMDKKRVIKSQGELMGCIAHQTSVRLIKYEHATHLLRVEEADKRAKIVKKKARKAARVSRKRNR